MHWKWKVTGFVKKTNYVTATFVLTVYLFVYEIVGDQVSLLWNSFVLRLEQYEDSNFFIFLSKFWFFPCPTYAGYKLIALHNLPQFNFDLDLSAIFFSTINRLSHLII